MTPDEAAPPSPLAPGPSVVLVPTPIGNLGDLTPRALDALRQADLVAAEDTRQTGKLLAHHGLKRPMQPLHLANEHRAVDQLLDRVVAQQLRLAVCSDAGTPGISDPGYLLVRAALARDLPLDALPGPTALIPALVLSGLPCDRFFFEGFLPQKKGRQTRLAWLATFPHTVVLYEAPHRLPKLLQELVDHAGAERPAAVARELSKLHQDVQRGPLAHLLAHYTQHPPKGECVVVLGQAG